jgi:hypothetical protein
MYKKIRRVVMAASIPFFSFEIPRRLVVHMPQASFFVTIQRSVRDNIY